MKPSCPRLISALVLCLLLFTSTLPISLSGEGLDSPPNGIRSSDSRRFALMDATLHPESGVVFTHATLTVVGKEIEAIYRSDPHAPSPQELEARGFQVLRLKGAHVYPGMIDVYVETELPGPDHDLPGRHWNAAVHPEIRVRGEPAKDKDLIKELRKTGFSVAVFHPKGGVFRGQAAVMALDDLPSDRSEPRPALLRKEVFQSLAFDGGGNPNSLMGEIALIRQTLHDAQWRWRFGRRMEPNVLDELVELSSDFKGTPWARMFFNVDQPLEAFAVEGIVNEFSITDFVCRGNGEEYTILSKLDPRPWWVVPVGFPEKPTIHSIGDEQSIDLRELMAWERAPGNLARLEKAGFRVVVTSSGIHKGGRAKFWENLREAVKAGLDEDKALDMLTRRPAELIGLSDRLGSLESGKLANFLVTRKPLFGQDCKLLEVWVEGNKYELNPEKADEAEGAWRITVEGRTDVDLKIRIDAKRKIELIRDDREATPQPSLLSSRLDGRQIHLAFSGSDLDGESQVIFSGLLNPTENGGPYWVGNAVSLSGKTFSWSASPYDPEGGDKGGPPVPEKSEVAGERIPDPIKFPFGPYSRESIPEEQSVLFVNCHLWTCGPKGRMEDGAFFIHKGIIQSLGDREDVEAFIRRNPVGASPEVVDLGGRHVTPGLIDCHSHTGISGGVNEVGQAVTAEVRVGDVTNPADINWYRQLAGGLTVAHSLHGSANPIGGQSRVVKLRWGHVDPKSFHFAEAVPGIKFALGENVKRLSSRYPNTRLGVEALIRDRFTAAKEYRLQWERYRSGQSPIPPRRDLELDALSEILEGERWIHCHSYRQDEILMLCRLAEEFGFKIGTFQHVLEGYKVAESIREHARGASCFSDWWAYKVEVQDAIPFAGSIMHQVGVNVSFNSDDSELARRMNLEAAKAVKYGGVPEEEALKFVTLNPAIQLGIDTWVGSLEEGKHADFVVWSDHPLSTRSRCESTWIDGRRYYSVEEDQSMREEIRKERAGILSKIIETKTEKKQEEQSDKPSETAPEWSVADEFYLKRGWEPTEHRCGWCGEGGHI